MLCVLFLFPLPSLCLSLAVLLDIDMLKDVVLDHRLPVAATLSEAAMAGAMTPGAGGATPYIEAEGNQTPGGPIGIYADAPWSPIVQPGLDDAYGGSTQCQCILFVA